MKNLKLYLESCGYSPLDIGKDHFWRQGESCFSMIVLRPSGERDGSFVVELKVGVIDEFMAGQDRYVFATNFRLNRNEVVYYTWNRHETWKKTEERELIESLSSVGMRHLAEFCDATTLVDFLTRGLHGGHPQDPKDAPRPRGLLGRLLGNEMPVGKPMAAGVPSFGYALGILSHALGLRENACSYLSEYRKTLVAPPLKERAVAVDRRIATLGC